MNSRDWARCRDELARAGIEGEAERIRRWIDPAGGSEYALRRRLEAAESALSACASPRARLLRGSVLLCLGKPREALAELEGLEGQEARLWRAEAWLRQGQAARALAELEPLEAPDGAALCLLAIAHRSRGDAARSRSALLRAVSRDPDDAVACGLAALFESESGDAASDFAERAIRLRPRAGWPLALRGLLRLREGKSAEGLGDLEAALRREPAAWIFRQRAIAHEQAAEMEAALADLDEAIRLSSPDSGLLAQRGHLLFYRKQYSRALADLSEAVRLEPACPPLLAKRAAVAWMAGRLQMAAQDLKDCERLAPREAAHRFMAARLDLFRGRTDRVRGVVKRLERSRDGSEIESARFLRGALAFRSGRFTSAAGFFGSRTSRAEAGPGASLSALLSDVAVAFDGLRRSGTSRRRKRGGGMTMGSTLILAGLGLDFPRQATLEVLGALRRCDVVFNNLPGLETMEFLGLLCPDVRTVGYEGKDEKEWASAILEQLRPGRTVAFVTRGHPLISGHLAQALLDGVARGVNVVSYGAISSIDALLALSQQTLSETAWGVQVYDARLLLDGLAALNPCVPMILYLGVFRGNATPENVGRFVDSLAAYLTAAYPASHRVFLYGPRYESRALEEVAVNGLGDRLRGVRADMLSSVILYLPALRPATPREFESRRETAAPRGA